MKKNAIVLVIGLCFSFFGCLSDDDGNRFVFLEIQDALVFENNGNYTVGDTIFIELNFSRYLDEDGFTNKLDIFESTGSSSFEYSLNLNKFSELSGGFGRIDIAPQYLFAEKGSIGDFGLAKATLDEARTQYESRIGLILAEAGRFEFDAATYISSSGYDEDRARIEIIHTYSANIPNFEFTVTE